MVALKYGSGVPLGKAAIVEASTSLSTWQAKNKAVTKSYNAGVSDLSSQYLSAGMGARCNPRKHEGSMLDFGMRLVNTAKVERESQEHVQAAGTRKLAALLRSWHV
eukprot:292791-Chlamydomonas_euryale.AAC.6